jgi:hypothetical protein
VSGISDLFSITIDFEKSHLFFPRIMIGVIILLLLIIGLQSLIKRLGEGNLIESLKGFRFFEENYDKIKLYGSIASVGIYFFLMDYLGSFFPNQGLGFLITSIPFMFTMSFLLVGKDNFKNHRTSIVISSIATPLLSWILFAKIFFITLP